LLGAVKTDGRELVGYGKIEPQPELAMVVLPKGF